MTSLSKKILQTNLEYTYIIRSLANPCFNKIFYNFTT